MTIHTARAGQLAAVSLAIGFLAALLTIDCLLSIYPYSWAGYSEPGMAELAWASDPGNNSVDVIIALSIFGLVLSVALYGFMRVLRLSISKRLSGTLRIALALTAFGFVFRLLQAATRYVG